MYALLVAPLVGLWQVGHYRRLVLQETNKIGAQRLLADPEYRQSLVKRLRQGAAPRLELHLWELAFGRPRVESEEPPTGAGATEGLVQILEQLGEPTTKTQNPSSHRSASPGTDQPDIEDELRR